MNTNMTAVYSVVKVPSVLLEMPQVINLHRSHKHTSIVDLQPLIISSGPKSHYCPDDRTELKAAMTVT
jgi:hypothetical protein